MKALASVLMVLIGACMVLASDLLFRANGIDGQNGIDAHAWDVMGTLVTVVGAGGFVVSILRKD